MKKRTKQIVDVALFTAVLCVISQIIIPIGAVPFSLSVFAVALVGAMLSPLAAAACVSCYLAVGFLGFPVFAGFKGGLSVLFGATGGFLLGYFFIALSVSFAEKAGFPFALKLVFGGGGILLCHLVGSVWFMLVFGTSFWQALLSCSLPFILPDIIKLVLALVLAKQLKKRLGQRMKNNQ